MDINASGLVEITISLDRILWEEQQIYEFYTEDDSAWTNNDKEIIYAMKKGVDLTITGISKRGTKTMDTYSLIGFTTAYNKLAKDC